MRNEGKILNFKAFCASTENVLELSESRAADHDTVTAIQYARRALRQHPTPEAYVTLGGLYDDVRNWDAAAVAWFYALHLYGENNPEADYAEIYEGLYFALAQTGNTAFASEYLYRAVQANKQRGDYSPSDSPDPDADGANEEGKRRYAIAFDGEEADGAADRNVPPAYDDGYEYDYEDGADYDDDGEDYADGEDLHSLLRAQLRMQSRIRLVWPPESVEYEEEAETAMNMIAAGNFLKAQTVLKKIPPQSPTYKKALPMLAIIFLYQKQYDQAEAYCKEALRLDPDGTEPLCLLASVYSAQNKTEESVSVTRRLLQSGKTYSAVDTYRIATLCCQNEMHAEAYEMLTRIYSDFRYEKNFLYLYAVAAWKTDRKKEAYALLDTLCILHPHSAVARFYRNAMQDALSSEDPLPELRYTYAFPPNAMLGMVLYEQTLKYTQSQTRLCELCNTDEADRYFDYALENGEVAEIAPYLVQGERMDYVQELLLSISVTEEQKATLLEWLAFVNRERQLGIVCGGRYFALTLTEFRPEGKPFKRFLRSYAKVYAKLVAHDPHFAPVVQRKFLRLHDALVQSGRMADVSRSTKALAAAMYAYGRIDPDLTTAEGTAKLFDCKVEPVKETLGVFLQATGQQEDNE